MISVDVFSLSFQRRLSVITSEGGSVTFSSYEAEPREGLQLYLEV